jgi:hypothetical protein
MLNTKGRGGEDRRPAAPGQREGGGGEALAEGSGTKWGVWCGGGLDTAWPMAEAEGLSAAPGRRGPTRLLEGGPQRGRRWQRIRWRSPTGFWRLEAAHSEEFD